MRHLSELLGGRRMLGAGMDLQRRVELMGSNGQKDVGGIIGKDGRQDRGMFDSSRLQDIFLRGVPLERQVAASLASRIFSLS